MWGLGRFCWGEGGGVLGLPEREGRKHMIPVCCFLVLIFYRCCEGRCRTLLLLVNAEVGWMLYPVTALFMKFELGNLEMIVSISPNALQRNQRNSRVVC